MTILERLHALATEYEKKAQSIRTTMALLNGHQKQQAVAALRAKIRKASKIIKGKGLHKTDKKHAYTKAALAILKQTKTPLSPAMLKQRMEAHLGYKIRTQGFGALVRYGYAKLTDAGYVATGKEKE